MYVFSSLKMDMGFFVAMHKTSTLDCTQVKHLKEKVQVLLVLQVMGWACLSCKVLV